MLYSTVLGLTNTRQGSKPGALSLQVLTIAGGNSTHLQQPQLPISANSSLPPLHVSRTDDEEVCFNKRGTTPPDRPSDPTKHRNRLVFRMTHYQPGWKDGNRVKWLQMVTSGFCRWKP